MSHPTKPDRLKELEIPIAVVLGERKFPLQEILELRPGKVLEFARRHDAPLEFYVGPSRLGSGCAVDLGERLGFLVETVDAGARSLGLEAS